MFVLYTLFLLNFIPLYSFDKITYTFTNAPIDIVIPCHEKDCDTLNYAINGIKKNLINIGKIFVVSKNPMTKLATWIPESIFPFSKIQIAEEIWQNPEDAKRYLYCSGSRIGWIYQQFIKLYALIIIPEISSNVLILDADTIFLNPVTFLNNNNAALFNIHHQHYPPYFEYLERLLGIKKVFTKYSGITNHMLFQRCVIVDLMNIIYEKHNMVPWKALCQCIDKKRVIDDSCMSEYEIYFNFCFSRSNQFTLRPLKFSDDSTFSKFKSWIFANKFGLFPSIEPDLSYISCHYRPR